MTMSSPKIGVVRLTENAIIPTRGSTRAAGLDLYSSYDITIPARGNVSVATDLQILVPEGHYGRIAPRSGLALHHHIDVGAGVIDEDYRGNVAVILFNHSDKMFVVNRGDRVAQLICEKVYYPVLEEEEKVSAGNATEHGATSKK
jgi:dUTP pyrophosphatase